MKEFHKTIRQTQKNFRNKKNTRTVSKTYLSGNKGALSTLAN